jgi:phage host-nuclease inhibitor protein Gam
MRLYEIPSAYRDLADLAESGEDVSSALATLDGELARKAEGVVYVLRNIDAEAEAYASEIKRLTDRKRAADANAERIRSYVRSTMEGSGITKIKAGTFSVTLGEGPERVEVDDESQIEAAFLRTKVEVSKSAILAHFKATGEIPCGVSITRGTRLVIR